MFDDINIIRVTASLESASGSNLVLPPTYEGGAHNLTAPRPDGSSEWASLDSPASFANRVEAALWGAVPGLAPLRVKVAKRDELSTIQMPHRCYDAILRESTLNGVPFPQTSIGQAVRASRSPHVEALFKYDPLVLLFGGWNSTALGERQSGPEAKFAAALSGEITATDVVPAGRAASRIDPLGIEGTAANLVEFADGKLEPYDEQPTVRTCQCALRKTTACIPAACRRARSTSATVRCRASSPRACGSVAASPSTQWSTCVGCAATTTGSG